MTASRVIRRHFVDVAMIAGSTDLAQSGHPALPAKLTIERHPKSTGREEVTDATLAYARIMTAFKGRP